MKRNAPIRSTLIPLRIFSHNNIASSVRNKKTIFVVVFDGIAATCKSSLQNIRRLMEEATGESVVALELYFMSSLLCVSMCWR